MSPWLGPTPQKRPDPGHTAGSQAEKRRRCVSPAEDGINGMKKLISAEYLIRFGVCGLVGLAIVFGSAGISRAEDDDDEPAIDTQIFRSILKGMGMRHEENSIDYRERSPLVVPQNRDLPKPDTASVTERNPQWPKDPDIQRAKK